jgi:hypothetical protein
MGRLSITYFFQKKEGDSSFKKATLRSWPDSAIRTAVDIFGICWKKFSANSMTEKMENLKCPFCENQCIEPAVGKNLARFAVPHLRLMTDWNVSLVIPMNSGSQKLSPFVPLFMLTSTTIIFTLAWGPVQRFNEMVKKSIVGIGLLSRIIRKIKLLLPLIRAIVKIPTGIIDCHLCGGIGLHP